MEPNELTLYIWTAIGMICHIGKKFHAWPNWNVMDFVKANASGIMGSIITTGAITYFVPDLVLLAPEQLQLQGIAEKSPRLVEKLLHVFGLLMGFTGGSVGFDVLALLYNLPLVGPLIKGFVEKLRGPENTGG